MSEDQVNDAHDATGNDYVENLNASDRDLLENFARCSKEEVRDDDEVTAVEAVNHPNKLDEDILATKDGLVVVDTEVYSDATFKQPRMFSEVESNEVRLLFEGTYLENSDEILKNLEKFPDAEITNNNLEVQVSSSREFWRTCLRHCAQLILS